MYSLIVFLIICTAQYLFFIWKRSEVRDYQELGRAVADVTTLSKRKVYSRTIIFLSNVSMFLKKGILPVILFIMFLNSLISIIIGTLIYFIVKIF